MSEVMNVPDGWEVKSLSDIGNIVTGNTPSTSIKEYYNGIIPFIGPSDLGQKKYIDKSEKTLTNLGFEQTRALPENTILVTCIGELGKIGISKLQVATNQQINSIICYKKFNTEFVYYALNKNIKLQMKKEAGLQVVPIVNKSSFSKLCINIPRNILEQQKIAKILSTLDDAIESTQKLIEKEKNIKKGLMRDLLTNGIDENGTIRTPQTHEYKQSDLGMIPVGWEVVSLEKLGEIITGSTPLTDNEEFYNGQIPFIGPVDFKGQKHILKTEKTVSLSGLQYSREIPKNTILTVCIGSTIGKIALTTKKSCTNQQINALVCKDAFFNEYIFYSMSNFLQNQLDMVAGLQAVPLVNKSSFSKLILPCSLKIEEQKQIAKILTTQDKKIETEQQNLAKLKELKIGLMDDLLSGDVRVKV